MKPLLSILFLLLGPAAAFAQGFMNLDFEASLLPNNVSAVVATADAFPGWTVYRAGVPQSQVGLNGTISPGSEISLIGNSPVNPPMYGRFYADFISDLRDPTEVSLAQTGQIPAGMGALLFKANNRFPPPLDGFLVSFAGTTLSLQPVGFFPGYTLWGADISAFAGTTGELRFTAAPSQLGMFVSIDDIMFSPVPEPSTWALLALGSALFACMARRRGKR